MNGKVLVLTAATIGVAIATSVGLSLVAPIGHAQEGHPESLKPDSVFSSSIGPDNTAAPLLEVATAGAQDSMSDGVEVEEAPAEETSAVEEAAAAAEAPASDDTTQAFAEQGSDADADGAGSDDAPASAPQLATAGSVPEGAGGSCAVVGVNVPGEPVTATVDGAGATASTESAADPATAEPAMEIAQADPTATPADDLSAAEASSSEAMRSSDADVADAPESALDTDEMGASDPAAAEVAAAEGMEGSCATGLTDPGEAPPSVVAGGYPGGDGAAAAADGGSAPAPDAMSAEPADAVPTPEPEPAEPAPEPAAPEPAPVAEPEPAPAPQPAAPAAPEPEAAPAPEPEPAPATTAPAPAPAAAAPAPKPKTAAAPKPAKPRVAPPEIKTAWWPAATAGKLNLMYAGEASFTKAIALLFDGEFTAPESADANIKVKSESGKAVKGRWLVASNPRMLLFSADPGLYTVEVGNGLKDKDDRALSASSSGPVFIP